jgi:hypothetical protein
MLALHDTPARRWEPRRLRFRLFTAAGRIVRGGRRTRPRLAAASPWSALITALSRLGDLAPASTSHPAPATGKDSTREPWNPAARSDIRPPAMPAARKDNPASRSGHRTKITKHRG